MMSKSSASSETLQALSSACEITTQSDMEPYILEKQVPSPSVDPDRTGQGINDFPDGGFEAWMVVLGDFISCFNTWGFTNSFGVFQTYYIENQLSTKTASEIAWIGSLETFLLFLPSFVVGRLSDAGYVRTMNIIGTFLQVFSLMMVSISSRYYQFILSQGIGFGLGLCLIFLPAVSVIPHWFRRRRALALGIGAAGSSVGGVVYPITLQKLIPKIGFGWAVRICAFIMLLTQIISIIYLKPRLAPRPLRGAKFLDLAAFKEPAYVVLIVGLFLGFWGLYTPFFYIGDFALYHNLPPVLSVYGLTIINAASTAGRILPNYIADKTGAINMMAPCVFLSGVSILVWLACTTTPSLIAFCIVFGFISGAFVSLPPAAVAAVSTDVSKTGIRVGQAFTIVSLAALTGTPISGSLISLYHGSFVGAAVFAGCVVMAGGIAIATARILFTGPKFRARL